jgi:hypothetical protein
MPDFQKTRIKFRRGTAAEFSSANPVLASGEPGFAVDTNTLKIGDGSTAWNSLSGISGGGGISNVVEDTTPQLGGELNLNNNDIVVDCKNDSGETLFAGTPVFISGYYSANGKYLIAGARADDPAKMPAVGLINTNIANGAEGTVGILGVASNVNTNSYQVGNVLYVHPTGGMTTVRPTGVDHRVQNVGKVLRKDASNGRIAILNPGRSNDIPNSGNFAKLCVDNSPVVVSDTTGITGASGVSNIIYISSGDYAALGSYDASTIYFIR